MLTYCTLDNTAVQSVHVRGSKLGSASGVVENESTEKKRDVAANECPGALPVGPCVNLKFPSSDSKHADWLGGDDGSLYEIETG
eukprot:6182488-Pleurochrysis_carterae.AAC.1